ncbi:MAG: G5 domain-containing protein [Clostridia bacterium]|nr:G5 domain-containing protein [Clostridia bacterium]
MNKDNEASISFKKIILIVIAAILLLSGMVVTFVSVKLGGVKIVGADRIEIAQSDEILLGSVNEADNEDSLQSELENYTTVTEKVVKEQEKIPYETETKDKSTGDGEKVERVVQNGSEGTKEIVYKITFIGGTEQDKIQIAENVIEEPVNCVKEIKDKEVPVVTARSSSSVDEDGDDEGGYSGDEDSSWSGTKLTKSAGVVRASETPSGYRETYYNLNMNGCLRAMGLDSDGYGVRSDGVKTYNGYVMVASPNLSKYPKGSYIPTTLGMGYVVDYCPSGALDIAVTW